MVTKGQKIDNRYEIIRLIGEGGMANVYLAYDPCLDRKVAVKILRGDLAEDEKFVRRFQREAVSASSLTHPNIVEVYDVGEDDGKYFIVMEYVEGKTLKQLIKKRGALTLPEVVDIMLQLTSAISKAHESYIIHRDIKPQNVIILEDGRVKVMDFGIAAQLNNGELTQTNSVMGTVYYLPPEQANGETATIKSDIYSLGILMYELVVGKVPFKGDSPVEVAIKQMKEPIPDIVAYNNDVPQSIENVILKACAKNPKNRYESAMEMHKDLETVLDRDRFNEPKVIYEYPETDFNDDKVTEKRSDKNKQNNDDKKMNKAVIIASIIAGVLFLGLIFAFFIYPKFISKPSVAIPDVSGMTVTKASNKLEEKGFTVSKKTTKKASSKIKKGKVVSTDPEAGRKVKKGTKVTLKVSTGSKKIKIGNYVGENYYEVKAELETKGLVVEIEKREVAKDSGAKENIILEQDVKAGDKIKKGEIITLTIPDFYTTYPDFAAEGYTEIDVKNFCNENGLTLNINYQTDQSKTNGTVTGQNRSGKVTKGDTVTVTVIKNAATNNSTNNTNNNSTNNTTNNNTNSTEETE